jgi:tetratricopeptide (TPR) repeat protein
VIELLLDAENLLALGLLDQAERTYHTVLEADPRNGIAAVGLSRVALERGDEAGAHALARAALAIDPENATARRMLDRLDEVARYRDGAGATAPAPEHDAVRPEHDESGPGEHRPGEPGPGDLAPAPPTDAAGRAAPARSGLLWRILRRS